jgi:hypothetical protein
MFKPFSLLALFSASSILLVTESAFSQPSFSSSKYPVVPISDIDKLVCYMRTENSRVLDLNSLCKTKPYVAISNLFYANGRLLGRVANKSDQTVFQTKVNYEIIGDLGNVIGRGAITTEPSTLNPGQTATFQTFMLSGRNIKITSAEGNEKE